MTPSKSRLQNDPDRPLRIAAALARAMPVARMELSHRSPWELLVATILSAQCTDQRVNQVTPALFKRYPTPKAFAEAKTARDEFRAELTRVFTSHDRCVDDNRKTIDGLSQAVHEMVAHCRQRHTIKPSPPSNEQ